MSVDRSPVHPELRPRRASPTGPRAQPWQEHRRITLDDAIAALYLREINCGVETSWDGGIKAWIGDAMNGRKSETMFSRLRMGDAGKWLIDEATRLYPKDFQ